MRRQFGNGQKVFPTPVGVFPFKPTGFSSVLRLPHARGGVSHPLSQPQGLSRSSPRPWGCFCYTTTGRAVVVVFPTPVGVFLRKWTPDETICSLPHARGGVSLMKLIRVTILLSSPRPWGCFLLTRRAKGAKCVFPTPVGVFP